MQGNLSLMKEEEIINQFIQNALNEDVGDGDHTSLATIQKGALGKAKLLVKEAGIIAGVDIALKIFSKIDDKLIINCFINDGTAVKPGDIVLHVSGSIHSILCAERLVLNVMQRMSGIATLTNSIVDQLKNTQTKILDTRKTTPNFRFFEKLAVKIGGGTNHRFALYDMILIKDNHVDYAGGIKNALNAARLYLKEKNKNLQIEIEVRNLNELNEVIDCGGADRIMLDNFSPEQLKEAISVINGRFITEASGGITANNILEYAQTGVNFISIGALTHSVKSLDLSLKAFKN